MELLVLYSPGFYMMAILLKRISNAVICVPRVSLFVLAICLTMFFADTFYVMGSSYTVCEDLLNSYTSC